MAEPDPRGAAQGPEGSPRPSSPSGAAPTSRLMPPPITNDQLEDASSIEDWPSSPTPDSLPSSIITDERVSEDEVRLTTSSGTRRAGQQHHGRYGHGQERMATWAGQASIRGGSETMRMILLNFNAIGITFTWGMEMTYCTPYLLNLGLSKSNTSLVWIAGPLSGLIVQPIVGAIADESKSKYGRRRPLLMLGTAMTAVALLTLGFTREIVGLVVDDDEKARKPTIVLAVLAIYVVDFAINAVMSCARSLIVDTLPIHKQQAGAAWFSRMSAIGHMFEYTCGAIDLVGIFGTFLGDTQFKKLSIIAVVAIIGSSSLTCWAVEERVLLSTPPTKHKGRFKVVRQIWSTILHLPPRIQAICWAQFWSWIGWFPFLFYGTTWVGETYFRYDAPDEARDSKDALGEIGRVGSTALVIYSIITFFAAFLLPILVRSPDDVAPKSRQASSGVMNRLRGMKPDLLTTWIFGHIIFSIAMSLAPLAKSFRFATALICLCSIPWTIALWAPVAFLGVEVNRMSGAVEGSGQYRRLSDASEMELTSRNSHDASTSPEDGGASDTPISSTGELSGIYFGILNIYTALPQFFGTFISTIVFAIFEPGKSPELDQHAHPDEHADTSGPNAIAICLFIGALSTFYAAFATRKLKYL